jgi:DNA repair exonuclease SbcCD ATPase subunit
LKQKEMALERREIGSRRELEKLTVQKAKELIDQESMETVEQLEQKLKTATKENKRIHDSSKELTERHRELKERVRSSFRCHIDLENIESVSQRLSHSKPQCGKRRRRSRAF